MTELKQCLKGKIIAVCTYIRKEKNIFKSVLYASTFRKWEKKKKKRFLVPKCWCIIELASLPPYPSIYSTKVIVRNIPELKSEEKTVPGAIKN